MAGPVAAALRGRRAVTPAVQVILQSGPCIGAWAPGSAEYGEAVRAALLAQLNVTTVQELQARVCACACVSARARVCVCISRFVCVCVRARMCVNDFHGERECV